MATTVTRRKYATVADVTAYDSTINTPSLEDISQAEELIDSYVGYHCKSVEDTIIGRVASATSTTITLEANRHQNAFQANYLLNCVVEIMDGTGSGQFRTIKSSTLIGVVTVDDAWDTTPDSTSHYQIYQLSKFPREEDIYFDGNAAIPIYVKNVPEQIQKAVCAQVQFMKTEGANYFASNATDFSSESIGNYSYNRGASDNVAPLIAPRAKLLLRGFMNRKGIMLLES